MDAATRVSLARLPIWTLAVCAVAGAVQLAPPLQALLIYDRAAIGDSELWRLLTGNLVHHSAAHFAYDIVALLIAGALIEFRRLRHLAALYLVSGTLIGVALYLGKPEIVVFAGLSGIATAAVTYLCLHGANETSAWRWLCLAVLVFLAVKTGAEMTLTSSPLFGVGPGEFLSVPESHIVGAAAALLLFLWIRVTRNEGRREALAIERGLSGSC